MQVCSTWRSVSRSELLWEQVSRSVWSRRRRLLPSWHEEFRSLHRTALNFRTRRCTHAHFLTFPTFDAPNNEAIVSCCRLALSDHHLAAGFINGTVRLFQLIPFPMQLTTFGPHPQQSRLGLCSQSISGLVLLTSPANSCVGDRLVFAFQDGDIHVAAVDEPMARRAHIGIPMEDGPLVDFTCSECDGGRWWVGLFAGVPGRSWHVWDGLTEQLVYVGGLLTDPDTVMGWHMLTDWRVQSLGRVRIPEPGLAVGCTASRIQAIDLNNINVHNDEDDDGLGRGVVSHLEFLQGTRRRRRWRGTIVDTVDACDGRVLAVDERRVATVRSAWNLEEEVCRFRTAGMRTNIGEEGESEGEGEGEDEEEVRVAGCMNWGYAVLSSSSTSGGISEIRVWDGVTGEYLYRMRESVGGGVRAMVASERYVAAWAENTGLHIWDFGNFV